MKKTRIRLNIVAAWGLLVVFCAVPLVSADRIYAPPYLWKRGIATKTDPKDIADTHLGIRYRDDGAIDSEGRFTTFSNPGEFFSTPGLNCSGLVLSISRYLFDHNFTLAEATRDRQGNSGPTAQLGQDWDFGLDLILNLTDSVPRRVLSPDGREVPLDNPDGLKLRGFDLHDSAAWRSVLSRMRPGRVYLASISKPTRKRGYKILHYHVGIMIPDGKGGVWLYHATRRSHVHRINLATRRGLRRLMWQFRDSPNAPKRILIVEALLPGGESAEAAGFKPPAGGSPKTPAGTDEPQPNAVKLLDKTAVPGGAGGKREAAASQPANGADQEKPKAPAMPRPTGPDLEMRHVSGRVYQYRPDLVTHIPRFGDEGKKTIKFWFRDRGDTPKELELLLRGPDGDFTYKGKIPTGGGGLEVIFPRDFGASPGISARLGRYAVYTKVDGNDWFADVFEIAVPREAKPSIIQVKVPSSVRSGKTFTITVVAQNKGAESDYGGITVSTPDPAGLRLVSAKPGRIYGRGSTVLSITSDKIRTKVPMAERWIELWGENKIYDMKVRIRAGRPGTYPLYVRCALRGVNVKSNVVLMDPPTGNVVDQQGFPVKVYMITVR